MDQTAAHVSYKPQQPERKEYNNNRPQHCFFLLLSQVLERGEPSHFQERIIEAQRAYRERLEFLSSWHDSTLLTKSANAWGKRKGTASAFNLIRVFALVLALFCVLFQLISSTLSNL